MTRKFCHPRESGDPLLNSKKVSFMLSRNTLTTAAIVGFFAGSVVAIYANKKINEMFGSNKEMQKLQDAEFIKAVLTNGLVGSAISVSVVGLFAGCARGISHLVEAKNHRI
jgi:uncharacterized membrane protein YraQ (UPF0718 family)